jgi:hypothetical protein
MRWSRTLTIHVSQQRPDGHNEETNMTDRYIDDEHAGPEEGELEQNANGVVAFLSELRDSVYGLTEREFIESTPAETRDGMLENVKMHMEDLYKQCINMPLPGDILQDMFYVFAFLQALADRTDVFKAAAAYGFHKEVEVKLVQLLQSSINEVERAARIQKEGEKLNVRVEACLGKTSNNLH